MIPEEGAIVENPEEIPNSSFIGKSMSFRGTMAIATPAHPTGVVDDRKFAPPTMRQHRTSTVSRTSSVRSQDSFAFVSTFGRSFRGSRQFHFVE